MSRDEMLRDMEFIATWNARNSKHPEDSEKRERSGYYDASTTDEQDVIIEDIVLGIYDDNI